MPLPRSSACCIQLAEDRNVKTSFGGPLPKKGCLMLDLSIVS
jgi:hypothetical protein